MSNLNSDIEPPKRRRLFSIGKRVFDQSAVTNRKVDAQGKLHAIGEPALQFDDGAEEHWFNGRLQSTDDKPALCVNKSNECVVDVYLNHTKHKACLRLTPLTHVWCEDGFIHRDGAPAVSGKCEEYALQQWWKHGLMHRDGGPAVIKNYSDSVFEEWLQLGLRHRDGGPALTSRSSDEFYSIEQWWQHGLKHRDGGPAQINSYVKRWYQHGLLHREDGPAVDFASATHHEKANPYAESGWYWQDEKMLRDSVFSPKFDYEAVPPEFVLRALAYVYPHSESVKTTPESIARASIAFPELASLLENAPLVGMTAEQVAQRINDVLAGRETCESFAVDGLVDFEPL